MLSIIYVTVHFYTFGVTKIGTFQITLCHLFESTTYEVLNRIKSKKLWVKELHKYIAGARSSSLHKIQENDLLVVNVLNVRLCDF